MTSSFCYGTPACWLVQWSPPGGKPAKDAQTKGVNWTDIRKALKNKAFAGSVPAVFIPLAPLNPQTLFVGWIPTAMNSKTNRCVVQKPYSVPCMRRTIPRIGVVKTENIAIGNVGFDITSKAIH